MSALEMSYVLNSRDMGFRGPSNLFNRRTLLRSISMA